MKIHIKICRFDENKTDIQKVRIAVFEKEQGVSRSLERDGRDPECTHVIALADNGTPIGTCRIQPDGKIGRMAVLKDYRGNGIGGRMLESIIEAARQNGVIKLMLHSQETAIEFYRKFGFTTEGSPFFEADIVHVKMVKYMFD